MASATDGASNDKPLLKAGLPQADAGAWLAALPELRSDFSVDARACSTFWELGRKLRLQLPTRTARNPDQAAAAALILAKERDLRERFLSLHVDELYSKLTARMTKFVRVEQLVLEAARLVPGLTPGPEALAAERELLLKEKDGIEIDQGIFVSRVLAQADLGLHLCHAMLLPRPESLELLPRLQKDGAIDLGTTHVSRQGKATIVELRYPRTLNALDDSTVPAMEIAVDLANLDRGTEIAVLRGGVVQHPKYAGRRICCSGLNLTGLYKGQISFLFYCLHVMGYENKILRGLASREAATHEFETSTIEKPWICVVEAFAIGGGCQHLLVMDYVLAESGAYLTLPARKEGIIPGMANLRLPRFVDDRLARQAIMYGRRIDCDSPEGRMICDEIAPTGQVDAALANVIDGLTSSGIVSFVGNRRQFRIGQEPLDLFRRYLASYMREQAYCHFSGGLISNLERYWNAQSR
jgi:(3,5-dihydroxyphenyl)acetyl-CoA 1,2-dioxygenase